MGVDTSIYNRLQAPQIESPIEAQSKVMQLRAMQNQNRLADLQFSKHEQAQNRQNKLMQLSQEAGGDVNKLTGLMYQNGFTQEAQGVEENQAKIGKTRADTGKVTAETGAKRGELVGQTLGALMQVPNVSGQQVAAEMQRLVDLGALDSGMMQKIIAGIPQDPAQMRTFLQTGRDAVMSASDQRKYTDVDANTSANNATSRANNAASNATTMRGQNMTDARSRETSASALSKPFEVTGPEGTPILVRQDKQGNISRVEGFGPKAGAGKAPTEFQGKSATFGARAEQADKIITDLEGKYSPAAINSKQAVGKTWLVGGALEAGANLALPANSQKAEQAQRDFVNAVLRQESGAAIAQSEFDNAVKQYFPQPGDSKAVIEQKAANRKTAIQGFKNTAGTAAFTAESATTESNAYSDAEKERRYQEYKARQK